MSVTYFVHATEDQAKIQREVDRLLGVPSEQMVERMEGHFGNEILKVEIHVTGKSATVAFETIISKAGPELTKEISDNADRYLDEHSAMFLRFDKQALVSGYMALGSADSIRIKIKPRTYLAKGGAISFYRGLMKGG